MTPSIIFVQSEADLPNLDHAEHVCIDFETDSGKPEQAEADPWCGARIALIGISDCSNNVWVIATKRCKRPTLALPGLDTEAVLAWLRVTLGRKRVSYVGHWIRAEANLARADACPLNRKSAWFCTEIGLHNENDCYEEYNLKWASEAILKMRELKEFQERLLTYLAQSKLGTRSHPGNFAEVETTLLGTYCALDVFATVKLREHILANLDAKQMRAFSQDCEANKIFHDMQYRGVRLDIKRLFLAKYWYMHEMMAMGEMASLICGKEFNPQSGAHVQALLCHHYGLPIVKWNKPDKNAKNQNETPSFDDEAMQIYLSLPEVRDGRLPGMSSLIWCISRYREATKILGYIDGLLENATSKGRDGRVHGSIHPCRARGGRTTSNDPNLQNFPLEVKDFLLPDEGCGFLNVDASQIEYRFMAHYMQDLRLINGFKDRAFDNHTAVQQWMGLEERDHAKVFNFGIAFNMGAEKIARTYAIQMRTAKNPRVITLEDGLAVFKRYTSELPCLIPTRQMFAKTARTYGYVRNFFGRKAYLEPDKSYKAFNRGNQGGAADLVKNRMIAVQSALEERGLEGVVQFLLMVHDELLFQIVNKDILRVEYAIQTILDVLEGFDEMRVVFYWDSAYCVGSWYDVAICKKNKKNRPARLSDVGKHKVKHFGELLCSAQPPSQSLSLLPSNTDGLPSRTFKPASTTTSAASGREP